MGKLCKRVLVDVAIIINHVGVSVQERRWIKHLRGSFARQLKIEILHEGMSDLGRQVPDHSNPSQSYLRHGLGVGCGMSREEVERLDSRWSYFRGREERERASVSVSWSKTGKARLCSFKRPRGSGFKISRVGAKEIIIIVGSCRFGRSKTVGISFSQCRVDWIDG